MTSPDPLRRYLDVRQRYEQAVHELHAAGKYLAELGQALAHSPIRLSPTNTAGYGFPMEVLYSGFPAVDFARWPEKSHILEQLVAYYQLARECESAYQTVPEQDRAALAASPALPWRGGR